MLTSDDANGGSESDGWAMGDAQLFDSIKLLIPVNRDSRGSSKQLDTELVGALQERW